MAFLRSLVIRSMIPEAANLKTAGFGLSSAEGGVVERILVAYATKHGSTREVAAEVARIIRQTGVEVEISPAREVKSLERYAAVVLGGALYMGRLHKDARRLLKRRRRELASLPVAVFAMGPRSSAPEALEEVRPQLTRALEAVPEVQPFSSAIFGGVIDPARLHFPFKNMPEVDARDWDAIRAWSEAIASRLGVPLAGG
jgi:menaquinone-dependent protoporphyrinogen oxidase